MPHRVGGVGYDGCSSLLAVVGECRVAVSLAWVDAHLQIGVRVKKHASLQTLSPDICITSKNEITKKGLYKI